MTHPASPSGHDDVPEIGRVLADPAASDAANDAEVLASILHRRWRQILAR
jgi:hypothetical protein